MNQLNQTMEEYQKANKKLFMMRIEQKIFDMADTEEVVSILKESGFAAISLICTDGLNACLTLAEKLVSSMNMPVVLETGFHKVFTYGIAQFAQDAARAGISGVRIPDLPFEEQGQLAVYLLEEDGPFLIREITPSSGDRIVQNMQFARGFIWCSSEGNVDFLSGLQGDPYMFFLYAVEAAATRPVLLEFGNRCPGDLSAYLESADGAIVGNALIEDFRRRGYSAKLLREYALRFRKKEKDSKTGIKNS